MGEKRGETKRNICRKKENIRVREKERKKRRKRNILTGEKRERYKDMERRKVGK